MGSARSWSHLTRWGWSARSWSHLLGQRHPLINGQSTIIPWIILLEQSLKLILSWNSKRVLQRSCQELLHHGWELCHLDDTVLVSIMISEDLQHVPVQLQGLSTARIVNSSLNEFLVLVNTSLIQLRAF